MITVGGTTGTLLANTSIDIVIHDAFHVIEHFHLVLWHTFIITMNNTTT